MTDYSERAPEVPSSDPMLMCCYCERLLDKPQRLRCLHSFCLSCLQPSVACAESDLQTATTTATCPICHVSSEVTRNEFLESRVSRHKAIAKSNLCGMCAHRGDDDQLAEVWCTSCSMSFCETCLPNHRSYHKAHSTILIDDVKSWDEVFPTPSPLCSSHTKPFDFVCLSCKVFYCSGCWPSCDKLKHDIRHVNDPTVSRYLEKAKEDVSSATHVLLRKAKILSRRKQLEAALEGDFINDLKKLQKAKQQLITVIHDVCFTVEQRLMDTYDGLRATAEAISRSSETMERKVDRAATYGRYVVDVGLPSELITQEQSLLSQIKSLCSELDQLEQPLDAGQYVSFDSPLLADQEQLVYLVTSWIGLPRAMTDDLCVRKAQPDMKLASVTVESGCLESNLLEEPEMETFEALLTPTEYMLTCCLCNRLVQFSVLLNCLHTCCSQCFSTATSRSAVGDVACGACSTITQAGSEQPNRFVDSQVLLFSTSAESKKCQACRDREHIKDAAVWCPACQLLLCADCSEWHRLFKEDHCTESLSELPQTLFSACPIHNETLDACVDCQQTKCRHCCRECSERKHTILAIGDDTFNGYVRDLIASISSTEKELNAKLKAHEKPHVILSILNSVRADHLQQIMSRRQRAREAVRGVYDRIECSTTQAYRELEMEVALTAAKKDHIELNFNNARIYFQRLVNSKRMHDIFDQHKIILKHLNVLCAELDQVGDTMCKNRTTNIELSLPEDMENVVRAGIGEPLLHTVADSFCAREAEPKASSASTEPGLVTDNPPFAERLSAVEGTHHFKEASLTAAMSIQAKPSSGSAVSVASAATAADYISGDVNRKPSSNESSSSEQGVSGELRRRLDSWKSIALNIGVIGASGVGKSSFINALRRLKPSHPKAAKAGVVQGTMEPTAYEHPQNPSVKLWDLPGVGTTEFPRDTYLRKINFDTYDFFIIVCYQLFTGNELWFAKEIRQADKRFYFVRTKVDNDIRSNQEDYPESHSEEAVLSKIRGNCTSELSRAGFPNPFVFLVCENYLLYDFPALEEKLIIDLPVLKQEAALLTLRSASRRIMAEKTAQLQKRSWMVAAASGVTALVPVPGLSIMVDTAIICGELTFYKKVYGLDDDALDQLSESANVSKDTLVSGIQGYFWVNLTADTLLKATGAFGIGKAVEEGSKFIPIPIIGSIIAGVPSFTTTKLFLRSTIQSMEEAALTVLNTAFSHASSKRF